MEYYRELEITMISADGIKDVNVFGKMDVYAVVWILGYSSTKKKTNVDTNSGTSPRWNHKMQLIIDERSLYNPNLFLLLQLKADKSIGEKNIGEVSIPIPELFENGGMGNDAAAKVVEYQVKTSSGKPKGTLKFSYKFGDKRPYDHSDAETKKEGKPVTVYPAKKGKRKRKPGASRPAMGYPFHPMRYPPRGYPGHPPQGYGAYPLPGGYPPPGYGHPPPPGYGYQQPRQPPQRINSGMGMALGLGLGAGLISAMVIGDTLSHM